MTIDNKFLRIHVSRVSQVHILREAKSKLILGHIGFYSWKHHIRVVWAWTEGAMVILNWRWCYVMLGALRICRFGLSLLLLLFPLMTKKAQNGWDHQKPQWTHKIWVSLINLICKMFRYRSGIFSVLNQLFFVVHAIPYKVFKRSTVPHVT